MTVSPSSSNFFSDKTRVFQNPLFFWRSSCLLQSLKGVAGDVIILEEAVRARSLHTFRLYMY